MGPDESRLGLTTSMMMSQSFVVVAYSGCHSTASTAVARRSTTRSDETFSHVWRHSSL